MDTYLKWCKDSHIPVYAKLGNHEFLWSADKGTQKFQLRFPMHKPAGYIEVVGSVAVISARTRLCRVRVDSNLHHQNLNDRISEARAESRPIAWVRHFNKPDESPAFVPNIWGANMFPVSALNQI